MEFGATVFHDDFTVHFDMSKMQSKYDFVSVLPYNYASSVAGGCKWYYLKGNNGFIKSKETLLRFF